jgi:hypothetical protein
MHCYYWFGLGLVDYSKALKNWKAKIRNSDLSLKGYSDAFVVKVIITMKIYNLNNDWFSRN